MAQAGLTQDALAIEIGTGRTTVNKWCTQKAYPHPHRLPKLAKILGVSEVWLAGYEQPERDAPRASDLDLEVLRDLLTLMGEVAGRHRDWFSNTTTSAHAVHKLYQLLAEGESIEDIRARVLPALEALTPRR